MADKTARLSAVKLPQDRLSVDQDFFYYEAQAGNNEVFKNRSSGAYIFRPRSEDPMPVAKKPETKIYKGPIVEEMHQWFNDWVSQVIKVYKNENYMEFEWLVGPIPVE